MRSFVLTLTTLLFFSTTAHADRPLTLREHMAAMGYLLDEVYAKSVKEADRPLAADKTRELRDHLVQAIALSPSKAEGMPPGRKRIYMLEFHQFMARVIFLTGSLEHTLIDPNFEHVAIDREQDIQHILNEISVAVGQAHGKFR